MRLTAIIGLILVMALVSLSSYLRLDHSGIGCTPWPDCYGNIGEQGPAAGVEDAYARLVAEARQPMSWARPMHRLIASVLGLLVLGLVGLSLQQKRHRLLSFVLLGLTVFLAWLGIYSEGLHSPAVVMGNLSGGFAMLAVFGLLLFEKNAEREGIATYLGLWTSVAIGVLCLQILLGGLTSANFAASACQSLPDCHGMWLPGAELWSAFDLSRSLQITGQGFVIGGAERADIHMLHRIVSLLTVVVVLIAGVQAIRSGRRLRPIGIFVCLVVGAEFLIGIAALRSGVPIGIAVSHNWLAGLLLLGLLRLRAR
jgi:cytochrome c oxidase assembly protein subunit 15